MNNKKPKIALFKKISQVAVLFTALASAQFSSAAMVSLNLNDILGFSQIDFSGSVSAQSAQTNVDANGVTFLTFWVLGDGEVSADIGSQGLTLDWSAFDTFSQSILNHDENTWNFSLSASDGISTQTSSTIGIAPDQEQSLSVSLLPLANLNSITEIYITISANLPLPGLDTVSEYELSFAVNEVPLPASSWFFSLSIAALLFVRSKRSASCSE
ncbi:hypothetical protein N9123_01005 [Pseudomonadales bacterium]|jgi:hypothetical protein|nr:hypothetical protein [Pseudomonadales bacterium]